MLRATLVTLLCCLAMAEASPGQPVGPVGPKLWVVANGGARVYVFGFGESRDTSWLTKPVRQAFDASSQLWLENARGPQTDLDQESRQAAAERMERLGHLTGRTLLDVLEPAVRERTLAYLAELSIPLDSVKTLRPWRAYYVMIPAFYRNRKTTYDPVPADATLERKARRAGKAVSYEFPTPEASVTFFAGMSDAAQSQYLDWLFDFLDDTKQGLNDDEASFGWISRTGYPTRSLERMRARPDLYRVMQPERNLWWARKIAEMLQTPGTYFVAVGQLHVLGPDSILRQLDGLGFAVDSLP